MNWTKNLGKWLRGSSQPPLPVVVYTRRGCCLCDEAIAQLQRHGRRLNIETRDVDVDPGLRQRFDACVPVVEIAGKIRFRGRINEVLLRRLLAREDVPEND
jgi:hypothetical protein